MGKIYYIMGKSSSGKDTLYKGVRAMMPELKPIVLYTTRPARQGETDGVEYYFVSEDTLDTYEKDGKVIELRAYDTVHGIWKYATVDDGQIDTDRFDYLGIGTPASYAKLRDYYGADRLTPLYIEVNDGERLMRALKREQAQKAPKFSELCRRYLADEADFSSEKLRMLGIEKRYINDDKIRCLEEMTGDIRDGKF